MNKTVCYEISEKSHVELKARLQYDGIPIAHFMKHIIECYLEKDDSMLKIVDRYKEKKKILNKRARKSARKRIDKGKRLVETFNLNNKEVEEVYDILENNIGGYEDL
tara:strand:+ start:523 stop:843 length:321 start_codon:yes stop_codon:yes gene_type:complete